MTGRVGSVVALACALGALFAIPAHAATEPSPSQAKAIKEAFDKEVEGKTTIDKIRVSTEDPDFAAVFYEIQVGAPPSRARRGTVPAKYKPPPATFKEAKGGKWKTVPTVPAKVKKDLKIKDPKSLVTISGDFTATLTRAASCTDDGDFYSASIYEPDIDLYLSLQFFQYSGHGWYPARSVGSVAGLYSDAGTVLRYETGAAHDAFASTGSLLAERGWGVIDAGMARTPPEEGTESNTVIVNGVFECR